LVSFDLISDFETARAFSEWCKSNASLKANEFLQTKNYWIDCKLTAANYENQIDDIVQFALDDPRFNHVDLSINYESFEDKPISEFHKFYFYINELYVWLDEKTLQLKKKTNAIRCFVDDNLNILLNPNEIYFEMEKMFSLSGEDLDSKTLNKIRQIVDIQFDQDINPILIDLDQNKKVMGDYFMVPYLAQMIDLWLFRDHLQKDIINL
jgi:hypothetical protein